MWFIVGIPSNQLLPSTTPLSFQTRLSAWNMWRNRLHLELQSTLLKHFKRGKFGSWTAWSLWWRGCKWAPNLYGYSIFYTDILSFTQIYHHVCCAWRHWLLINTPYPQFLFNVCRTSVDFGHTTYEKDFFSDLDKAGLKIVSQDILGRGFMGTTSMRLIEAKFT